MRPTPLPLLTAILIAAPPAAAQEIRQDIYYRLTTELHAEGNSLGVVNGGPTDLSAVIEPTANVSGQFWRIQPSTFGTVRLTTLFRGPWYCLDTLLEGDRRGEVALAVCNEGKGQRWTIVTEDNGYRLENDALGAPQCLDVVAEGPAKGRLRLNPCGFYGGQFWQLIETEQPVQ